MDKRIVPRPIVKNEKEGRLKMAKCLKFCTNHTVVSFENRRFKIHHLEHLLSVVESNYELETVILWKCFLGIEHAKVIEEFLYRMKTVKSLVIGYNGFMDSGMSHVLEGAINSKTLINLNISNVKMTSESADCIIDLINTNTVLEKLDIGGNKIPIKQFNEIILACSQSKTLKKLGLRDYAYCFDKKYNIIKKLQDSESVIELDLRKNKLSKESLVDLVDFIKKRPLECLNLSENHFDESDYLPTFLKAVEQSNTLKELSMCHCELIPKFEPSFMQILSKNKVLTKLYLSYNAFTKPQYIELAHTIQLSETFEKLDIRNNICKRKDSEFFNNPKIII